MKLRPIDSKPLTIPMEDYTNVNLGVILVVSILIVLIIVAAVYSVLVHFQYSVATVIAAIVCIGCIIMMTMSLSHEYKFDISKLEAMNNVTITRVDGNELNNSKTYRLNPAQKGNVVIPHVYYTTSDSKIHDDGIIVIRNSRVGLFRGTASKPLPITSHKVNTKQ